MSLPYITFPTRRSLSELMHFGKSGVGHSVHREKTGITPELNFAATNQLT
jgi:hypothetical protein